MLRIIALAALAALLALAAACSDDDDDEDNGDEADGPTATASGEGALCDQAAEVEQAVTDVQAVDVLAEGTDATSALVDDVRAEVDDLKEAAGDELESEITGMEEALDNAEEILSGIDDEDTLNEQIDAVQAALTGIATATAALGDALSTDCE